MAKVLGRQFFYSAIMAKSEIWGGLLKSNSTPREVELEIVHYMMFYNEERNYQGLNGLPSEEIYFSKQRYAAWAGLTTKGIGLCVQPLDSTSLICS